MDDVHETDPNVSFIEQVSDLVDETLTVNVERSREIKIFFPFPL